MRYPSCVWAAIACALLTTACGDTGAPNGANPSFDAAAISGNLATVEQLLGNGVWQNLGASGGLAAATGLRSTDGVRVARAFLQAPQIPPSIRGTTWVLDATTLQYVADTSRTGAPPNGVRFILYAEDSSTHLPLPEQEIGYADLTDEGNPSSPGIALRLRAVIGGLTRLDYGVTLAAADSSATLQAAGFTTDGTTRMEFRVGVLGLRAADTAAAQVQFAIGIPAGGFDATATLQHAVLAGDSAGAIAVTIRQGFDQVGMAAHVASGQLNAVFQVNGIPFATAQGDPANPVVQGMDGRPLTAGEIEALIGIHAMVGQVGEMFDRLMRPIGGMLSVGAAQ